MSECVNLLNKVATGVAIIDYISKRLAYRAGLELGRIRYDFVAKFNKLMHY
jgi:hypothetical protein